MCQITLRVIDGADRGQIYESLKPPITIGREEGNSIQLNDERISRFHIKIQEDQGKLVLTDLESTNGTRVNGEETQLRILRFGDVITVGRSVLLYGTREQITSRLEELKNGGIGETGDFDSQAIEALQSGDFDVSWPEAETLQSTLHIPSPPELPTGLSPGQAAQFSEILEFLHMRTRTLVQSISLSDSADVVTLRMQQWQDVLDLQALLAEYLRAIGEPGTDPGPGNE